MKQLLLGEFAYRTKYLHKELCKCASLFALISEMSPAHILTHFTINMHEKTLWHHWPIIFDALYARWMLEGHPLDNTFVVHLSVYWISIQLADFFSRLVNWTYAFHENSPSGRWLDVEANRQIYNFGQVPVERPLASRDVIFSWFPPTRK